MALIVEAKMPDCCGYGCDLWDEGICVPLQKTVDTHTRHPDCPILGEVDPDSFTRVIVTSGDGTVLGYKDISAREVMRLKDKPKEKQDA